MLTQNRAVLYLPVTDMPGDFEVSFYAVVRGFHVYQAIWTPTVGEALAHVDLNTAGAQ